MTTTVFETRAWQLYEKMPRPALRWLCLLGTLWVFGLCDVAGFPIDSAGRGLVLAFVATVYGLRGLEKFKEQGID